MATNMGKEKQDHTMLQPTAKTIKGPYSDESANLIYELLFCDNRQLFKDNHHGALEGPWPVLFSDPIDVDSLWQLAADTDAESRLRALAFHILRSSGQKVPEKQLLGTIVEVGLPEELDTLAAFVDGSARYIHHTGRIAVVEGAPNDFESRVAAVIKASKPIVEAIGPWPKGRLKAPGKGNIRLSFLVSDGLYFGEGPMGQMQQERLAASLIDAAAELLQDLVDKATSSRKQDQG